MSDFKLFQFGEDGVAELPGTAVQVEKSLPVMFEANLEALLAVRFLTTGRKVNLPFEEQDVKAYQRHKPHRFRADR